MRFLLYSRLVANLGADWAEDVCSLERIGVLPKGTLSVGFLLFAEYCQLVLALIEAFVTTASVRKLEQATEAAVAKATAAGDSKSVVKAERKLGMLRLELVKFVSDLGKAVYDCEFPFASENVFIGCALFSGIISTHKNIFKVVK